MAEVKIAVGLEFFNKFYYCQAILIDNSADLNLGFNLQVDSNSHGS